MINKLTKHQEVRHKYITSVIKVLKIFYINSTSFLFKYQQNLFFTHVYLTLTSTLTLTVKQIQKSKPIQQQLC